MTRLTDHFRSLWLRVRNVLEMTVHFLLGSELEQFPRLTFSSARSHSSNPRVASLQSFLNLSQWRLTEVNPPLIHFWYSLYSQRIEQQAVKSWVSIAFFFAFLKFWHSTSWGIWQSNSVSTWIVWSAGAIILIRSLPVRPHCVEPFCVWSCWFSVDNIYIFFL